MTSVVGIDLGFQYSVIAAAGRGGVDVILNGNSNRLNPTMVGFDTSRKLGEQASTGAASNYKQTVFGIKRLVGLAYDDARAQREMARVPVKFAPYARAHGPASIGVKISLNGGDEQVLPVESVLGMMVKHMGYIAAEKAVADSSDANKFASLDQLLPQDWVIAIPNYYTDAQRRAVLDGCEMVGISGVQRLMHENTATALAYGIFKDLKKEFAGKEAPTNVLFIDFGASAYTVSVVAYEPGKLTVKSAFCDADVGGRDFDHAIAKWIAQQFKAKYGSKLSGEPMDNPRTLIKLLTAAEKAKKTLSPSGVKEAHMDLEMLMDDYDFHVNLQAAEYEELCEPLLARLAGPIQKALDEAKIQTSDLSSVEIVGGTSRIGCVKRKLQEVLGLTLSTTMNADEAVARGAALQSAILSPRFKVLPYEIIEAQPYPIKISWQEAEGETSGMEVDENGVETASDSVIMFDRGLNFPIVRRVTLRRAGEFAVHASYAPSAQEYGLAQPESIADFTIKGIAGADNKVRVNIKEDIHGIIHLSSAQMVEEIEDEPEENPAGGDALEGEEEAKKKKKIRKTNLDFTTIRPLSFTKSEMTKINEMVVEMANNDRIIKETADMRNELESYIYDMRDKIISDNHLGLYGTSDEKAAFQQANEAMENWLYEDGFDGTKKVYADKLEELKKLGSPIERRQVEAQARSACVEALKGNLDKYQNWVNNAQADENYAHITDEEREKVRAVVDSTSGWMYEMLDKQGSLGLHQDPVLTTADLKSKNSELVKVCSPVMNKPKPLPKKEPEPKKEDPPAAQSAEEPMEGVEKESEDFAPAAENVDATNMEVDS
ncbi:hypothetical protein MPSEU_000188400 [Mayamaea pseudoterrestris]|nr:hypothetical protein MPSEU_000188400 [Mayamaea pseudoterrestris]